MALTGATDAAIATHFTLAFPETMSAWKKKYPELVYALEKARSTKKAQEENTFQEYVYARLPNDLQQLWDKIAYWFEHANGYERITAILSGQTTRARQYLWIHAMVSCNFNASDACHRVCVSRKELIQWETEEEFTALMDELQFHKQNFVEGALMDLTAMRNPVAVTFANKTLNKNRGYSEKLHVEHNHSGTIIHKHAHIISVDKLNLPFDVRCQLLDAVRGAKQVTEAEKEDAPIEDDDADNNAEQPAA
jgi:hypothetical protein